MHSTRSLEVTPSYLQRFSLLCVFCSYSPFPEFQVNKFINQGDEKLEHEQDEHRQTDATANFAFAGDNNQDSVKNYTTVYRTTCSGGARHGLGG